MLVYELNKGTELHGKLLGIINQLDKWKLFMLEVNKMFGFKYRKKYLIRPYIYENSLVKINKEIDNEEILKNFNKDGFINTESQYYNSVVDLIKRFDLTNIDLNIIDELAMKNVLGKDVKIILDKDNFALYLSTENMIKQTNKNKKDYNIFYENYKQSNVDINSLGKAGK